MIKRLILTFILNIIFAWSLYLLGWQYWDMYAFLFIIPLVFSVALTLSAGHWALWNQGNYGRNRIILNACFNVFFAFISYSAGWYDKRNLPIFENGLNVILLMAVAIVFIQWALGSLNQETNEKKKREQIDSVLRDLSDDDLLRLKERLVNGTISESHLEDVLVGEDSDLVNERR
jgi:hypothetical protein